MPTYTELLLQIASERRMSSAKITELRNELHEWQHGCQRAELYAEWLKQRLANVLQAADEETLERLQQDIDRMI